VAKNTDPLNEIDVVQTKPIVDQPGDQTEHGVKKPKKTPKKRAPNKTELCPHCAKACAPKGISAHIRQKHPNAYNASKQGGATVLDGVPVFAEKKDTIPVHDYSKGNVGKPVCIVITMEGDKIACFTDEPTFISALEGVNQMMPILGEKGEVIHLSEEELGLWGPYFYRYLRRNYTKFLNNLDENIMFYAITAKIFIPRLNKLRSSGVSQNDNPPPRQIEPIKEPGDGRQDRQGKDPLVM